VNITTGIRILEYVMVCHGDVWVNCCLQVALSVMERFHSTTYENLDENDEN
jgi:hypothetical protein